MPIVVDEVVISVEVSNQDSGGAVSTAEPPEKKEQLVEECVERVLEILRQKAER